MNRDEAVIAVVGAGPAGQALALALAQRGCEPILIDAAAEPPLTPVLPDLRVFALSPASTGLLSRLAAWPPPQMHRVAAYRYMQVWQRDPDRGVHFDAALMGWPRLGHIVEHGVLQQGLAERIIATGLRCRWGVRVEALRRRDDGIELGLDDGSVVRARLVVGADGAASPVRALAGIEVSRLDYRQRGLVANLRCSLPHGATARQRFLPGGPLAWLPLADPNECSIVWSVPDTEALRLRDLPDAAFERELAIAAGGVLGTLRLSGERALFPLARQLAQRYHADRVALVADAAHVVHPLAGQGLNLGLLDVAALAQVLGKAIARGLDPGDEAVLARYARWRQGDNALAARAFEAIDLGYRASLPLLGELRDLGQRVLDRLPALKRHFILHASGLAGRVPELCGSGVDRA